MTKTTQKPETENIILFKLAVRHPGGMLDRPWLYDIAQISPSGVITKHRKASENNLHFSLGESAPRNTLLRITPYLDSNGRQVIQGDVYGILEKDLSASEAFEVAWDEKGYFKLADCYSPHEDPFDETTAKTFLDLDFIGNVHNPAFKLPKEWEWSEDTK
jgi:hypothetical protein